MDKEFNDSIALYQLFGVNADNYQKVKIRSMNLMIRTFNCLRREGIITVRELLFLSWKDILNIRGFGKECYEDLDKQLNRVLVKNDNSNFEIDKNNKTPLCELYGVKADLYRDISIREFDVSIRTYNCLQKNNVSSLYDLLLMSWEKISQINGFGIDCYNSLRKYLSKEIIKEDQDTPIFIGRAAYRKEVVDLLLKGEVNDLDISGLNYKEQVLLDKYKEIENTIGHEETRHFLSNIDYAKSLRNELWSLFKTTEIKEYIDTLFSNVPQKRLKMPVGDVLKIYFSNTSDIYSFLGEFDENESLYSFVIKTYENNKNNIVYSKFIKWCSSNVNEILRSFFEDAKINERMLLFVRRRAEGERLEQIGKDYDLSRERVRQIEGKFIRYFTVWDRQHKFFDLIRLDYYDNAFIERSTMNAILGENGSLITYVFIQLDQNPFNFDAVNNAFILCDPKLWRDAQIYIDNLPDIISISSLDNINTEGLSKDVFWFLFNKNYIQTGEIYHRDKLTLKSIYTDILERYYPCGFHIYDPHELQLFRDKIFNEYGDIELSASDRALSARLADIGTLCGRGIYRPKGKTNISEDLLRKIYNYIVNGDSPAYLTNVLFAIFEDELVEAGIDNKYYLQGILKEFYGDELFFRRDYIAKNASFTSIYSSVIDFIKEALGPVSKQEIIKKFPGITEVVILMAVDDYDVINLFGSYLHINNIDLSSDEKQYLKLLVKEFVKTGLSIHCKSLYDDIIVHNPQILSRNYIMGSFGLFSLLESLFHDDFNFSRPYIARSDVEIERTADSLKTIIEESDTISIGEIRAYAKQNHLVIQSMLDYINSFNDTHLFINSNYIASIEIIGVDIDVVKNIEKILDNYVDEPIPIIQLPCIHLFNKINVEWNEWLIYSIINKWSDYYEVEVSHNQMQYATPLISKKGKMDKSLFDNLDHRQNNGLFIADDMDNIDDLVEGLIDDDIVFN